MAVTDPEAQSLTRAIAERIGFRDIIPVDERTFPMAPPADVWPLPVGELTRRCRHALGAANVQEIWVSFLDNFYHRLIFESYPGAALVLYEEGLYAASPYTVSDPSRRREPWLSRLSLGLRGKRGDHARSLRLSDWRLAPETARRVDRRYTWLGARYPAPAPFEQTPVFQYDETIVTDVLEDVRQNLPGLCAWTPEDDGRRDRVLVLSQFSCRQINQNRDAYMDPYYKIVEQLVASGHTVYWKEHPRSERPTGPLLQARFGGDRVRCMDAFKHVPVELLVQRGQFTACVSMSSASLFHLETLYGIKGYTCVDMFAEVLPDNGFGRKIKWMMRDVPSWQALRARPCRHA